MTENKTGRIIKGIGGFYYIDTGSEIFTCRARGKLRKLGITPCVGDISDISVQDDGTGYILSIKERKNSLIRPPVSNIDMIAIIASKAAPETDMFFIDRISAIAVKLGIGVCIVINKCDEDVADELYRVYKNSNVDILRVSAKSGVGIDELRKKLSGKFTAFTGNSGVGKSTLINTLIPEAGLRTGEINDRIGRGRHTTRQVEILKVSDGTWIADTPGFSAFDMTQNCNIGCDELDDLFPEFGPYIESCRFIGCSHINNSGCAVLAAVDSGKIERSRYESYKKMYEIIMKTPKYK